MFITRFTPKAVIRQILTQGKNHRSGFSLQYVHNKDNYKYICNAFVAYRFTLGDKAWDAVSSFDSVEDGTGLHIDVDKVFNELASTGMAFRDLDWNEISNIYYNTPRDQRDRCGLLFTIPRADGGNNTYIIKYEHLLKCYALFGDVQLYRGTGATVTVCTYGNKEPVGIICTALYVSTPGRDA